MAKGRTTGRRVKASGAGDKAQQREHAARRSESMLRVAALRHKVAEESTARRQFRQAMGSGDHAAWMDRELVMNHCRAMDQRSPLFRGMIDRLCDLIVGTGIIPVGVGRSKAADKAAAAFIEWMDRCPGGMDARGLSPGGKWQRMFVRGMLVDGDIGATLLRGDQMSQRDQSVQTVEADRIVSKSKGPPSDDDRDGVTVDPVTGEPVSFHVANYLRGGGVGTTGVDVPADRFIFLSNRDRHSQTRGLSILAAGVDRLISVDEYTDAVEKAAKVQALFALILKTQNPTATRNAFSSGTMSRASAAATDGGASEAVVNLFDADAGQVLHVGPTDEAQAIQSTQPAAPFEMFMGVICRAVCAGIGLPVEVALGDFSKANFSVSRMAMNQAMNTAAVFRGPFVHLVLKRLYRWRCSVLMLRGELERDPAVFDVRWQAPARVMIDPVGETQAWKTQIDSRMASLDEFHTAYGKDLDAVFAQIAYEQDEMRRLGIMPVQQPGQVQGGDKPTGKAKPAGKDKPDKGDEPADPGEDDQDDEA